MSDKELKASTLGPTLGSTGAIAGPILPVEEELPNDVCRAEQVPSLPAEVLSGDPLRPLLFIDDRGHSFRYHLRPMQYSVMFILLVELLERFAFYGITTTLTSYLTGAYNEDWNADLQAVEASSYVSLSTAIAYTFPFAGAMLADQSLGDYYAILVGACCFYLPGLGLIAMTAIPGLLGSSFNRQALRWGLLLLWPIGTGAVKSVVNVFGARQFHPILQASQVESFYVKFYVCINVGALVGSVLVPLTAQVNVIVAYVIPVVALTVGVCLFLIGTQRYVRTPPRGDFCGQTGVVDKYHAFVEDQVPHSKTPLQAALTILRISILITPFNIAYSQMSTTFIVQGTVMRKLFGCIDAAMMNNCDSISILTFGYLIGNYFYPFLIRRGIKIPTTYKFAIGSALGAAAIAWALLVDKMIHSTYEASEGSVSVAWQAMSYILIGCGEIFAVSSAYEAAFNASPAGSKALASAVNLFCIGGLPNFLCIGLYHVGAKWFRNSKGRSNISHLPEYTQAAVYKYFAVLLVIALLGILINMLPSVRQWVASIEEEAAVSMKTPNVTPKIGRRRKLREDDGNGEEEALLKAQQHQNYLKYGTGPTLYKNASFRAGVVLKSVQSTAEKKRKPAKYVKYPQGLILYKHHLAGGDEGRQENETSTVRNVRQVSDEEEVQHGEYVGNSISTL